jgi:RHS repeat-associated protein
MEKNNDAALVTYTWGPDLSGTFGGAGGVGGLLGISKKTVPTANLSCLYDGNGNITQLVDMATGDAKAHYEYDPFGNLIKSEGVSGLQTWNKFRFSTKQIEDELLIPTTSSSAGVSPDLYYYGYRYYSPRLGRWINQDPIEENGGGNLVVFVENDPIYRFDGIGLISRKTKKMICLFINALGHLAGGQIGDPLTWGEIIEDPSTDILDPKNLAPTRITPPQSSRSKIYYPKKLFRGKCGGYKMRSGGCIALELTIVAFAREIGYAGIDWSDWRLPTVRAKCQPFGLVNYWECSCPEGYNLTGASSLPDASYFLIPSPVCPKIKCRLKNYRKNDLFA